MGIELNKKSNKINLSGELLRGEPGGYYIPTVDMDGNLTWEATQEKMPDVEAANIKGRDAVIGATPVYRVNGEADFNELVEYFKANRAIRFTKFDIINDGEPFNVIYQTFMTATINTGDIYSISLNDIGNIYTAMYVGNFVLEADGYIFKMWDDWEETEKLIPVLNGKQGETGETGAAGKDGVSPVVSSVEIDGGHRITILSYGKMITFDVMDGKQGEPGATGAQGKKGDKGDTGEPGKDGEPGANGVSVSKVEVDANNHLQVTLSNGTTQDAGQIAVSGGGGSAEWDLLIDNTIATTGAQAISYTITDGSSYDAITALMYFPKMSAVSTLATMIDGKAVCKITEALPTDYNTVLRIEAERKYYWTNDYMFWRTSSTNSASTIIAGNIAYGVEQKHIKGFYKNYIAKDATSSISFATNQDIPVGTVVKVFGRRVNK